MMNKKTKLFLPVGRSYAKDVSCGSRRGSPPLPALAPWFPPLRRGTRGCNKAVSFDHCFGLQVPYLSVTLSSGEHVVRPISMMSWLIVSLVAGTCRVKVFSRRRKFAREVCARTAEVTKARASLAALGCRVFMVVGVDVVGVMNYFKLTSNCNLLQRANFALAKVT